MGITETKEVLSALRKVSLFGAKIFADGKLSVSDLKYLSDLGGAFSSLKKAIDNINLVDDELKDLSMSEATEILTCIYGMIKEIKEVKEN